MLRTGPLATLPEEELDAPLRRTGSLPPPGASLPRTLASPGTGLSPAGWYEFVARDVLSPHLTFLYSAPELSGRT